jgi:hypothetical protein
MLEDADANSRQMKAEKEKVKFGLFCIYSRQMKTERFDIRCYILSK